MKINRLLVLCEGNICRSPMAEALLRDALSEANITVASAGLGALVDHPADPEAVALIERDGLSLKEHSARQFTDAVGMGYDLILVMSKRQKKEVEARFPMLRGRVFLLAQWLPPAEQEVADPYQLGTNAFEKAHAQIKKAVESWKPHLLPSGRS